MNLALRMVAIGWVLPIVLVGMGVPETALAQGKAPPFAVKVIPNVAYVSGGDADPIRHKLDLYVPEGATNAPVLFYVHGGAWTLGDKNQFGIPAKMGKTLARNGILMVSINYRLSPKVKHPEHIRDVAQAFAWTYENIGKYGGCRDDIFVSGHSAGGHLSALLATDEQYLKKHSLSLKNIQGAIPLSGVFTIPPNKVFASIFSSDAELCLKASPIAHARSDAPPFLIIYADGDLPGCDAPAAKAFHLALLAKKARSQILEVKNRNHVSIWFQAAQETDPVNQAIMGFMVSHVTLRRLASDGTAGIDLLQSYIFGSPSPQPLSPQEGRGER